MNLNVSNPDLRIKKTDRGFDVIEFLDYYSKNCSLQQSSIATGDYVWLGVDEPEVKILASKILEGRTGWANYPLPEGVEIFSRMHLSREQVRQLLPHLIKFVETGDII